MVNSKDKKYIVEKVNLRMKGDTPQVVDLISQTYDRWHEWCFVQSEDLDIPWS